MFVWYFFAGLIEKSQLYWMKTGYEEIKSCRLQLRYNVVRNLCRLGCYFLKCCNNCAFCNTRHNFASQNHS